MKLMRTELWLAFVFTAWLMGFASAQEPIKQTRRPSGQDRPPVIGAWFWNDATLEPEGYKAFLDAAATHAPYTLLTTSLRISKGEVTDPPIREQIGKAVRYADSLGLKVAFDLDVRLARRAFQARYPDELQEELVLKTVELPTSGTAEVTFEGKDLTDHMTGNTIPFLCLTSRLVRVYAFARGAARGFGWRYVRGDQWALLRDWAQRNAQDIPSRSRPRRVCLHNWTLPSDSPWTALRRGRESLDYPSSFQGSRIGSLM